MGVPVSDLLVLVGDVEQAAFLEVRGEQLHTDRTTMTRNLRTLQQAGFIDLVPGADARSRCVVVTPEGRARIREAAALWRQAQLRVRELCGSEQIGALESLVLGMLPVLETATQESAE